MSSSLVFVVEAERHTATYCCTPDGISLLCTVTSIVLYHTTYRLLTAVAAIEHAMAVLLYVIVHQCDISH